MLSITHEPRVERLAAAYLELELQLEQQARDVQIVQLECSRPLLVPYIWSVPASDWDSTKRRCAKCFAWKLKHKGKGVRQGRESHIHHGDPSRKTP